MPESAHKSQEVHLHDMLEAARHVARYVKGINFDEFQGNAEKCDAVALRLSVLGEAASRINKATEAALPEIPFGDLRGLRNRIVPNYGSINFRIVWDITQRDIKPLASHLKTYLALRSGR